MANVMSADMYKHISDNLHRLDIDTESGIITTSIGTHGTSDNSSGYLRIRLARRLVQNHQVIAVAVFGEDCIGKQINHRDGKKTNNKSSNLELSSPKRNAEHAYAKGLMHNSIVDGPKIPESEVLYIRESDSPNHVLARHYGVSTTTIARIKSGRRK